MPPQLPDHAKVLQDNGDYPQSMVAMAGRDRPTLRPVRESDIEFFYGFQADPEAARMAAFTSRDREQAEIHWRKLMASEKGTERTIVIGDTIVGYLVSWVDDDGHREVGYWIGRQFWGRGVATAALHDFLEIVTERPVEGWIAPHNTGSARVLEKNGFAFDRDEEDYRVYRLG